MSAIQFKAARILFLSDVFIAITIVVAKLPDVWGMSAEILYWRHVATYLSIESSDFISQGN